MRKSKSLQKRIGNLGLVTTLILVIGSIYGIIGYLTKIPVFPSVYIFPVAGLLGAWILLRNKAFISAWATAIMCVMLLYSTTLTSIHIPPEAFSWDLTRDVFVLYSNQAVHVLLTFTGIMSAILIIRSPSVWQWPVPTPAERGMARATWFVSLIIAFAFAFLSLRSSITGEIYGSPEYMAKLGILAQEVKGIDAVVFVLMVYSITSALRGYGQKHRIFFLVLAIVVFWLIFLRLLTGERATAAGFMLIFISLYYFLSEARYKIVIVLAALPLCYLFLNIWAGVRHSLSEIGLWQSILSSWEFLFVAPTHWSETLLRMERFGMFWSLLDTMDLYERGIRRSGETYINLIPQSVPGFITDFFNYERPTPEPVLLYYYHPHAGDIFIVAEAFWNGGLLAVIVLAIVLAWLFSWLERLYRQILPFFAYGYFSCMELPPSLLGSTQGFVRWLQIVLAATFMGWLIMHAVSTVRRTRLRSTSHKVFCTTATNPRSNVEKQRSRIDKT